MGARIFAYPVRDPERYGVVEFGNEGMVLGIEEKPKQPRSNDAVPGIYFYDSQVVELAANLQPSTRGELEITDLNRIYLERGQLSAKVLERGYACLDAGTRESLLQAATFIQTMEERQGKMISCSEGIAFRMGFINTNQLIYLAEQMKSTSYGYYLSRLAKGTLE